MWRSMYLLRFQHTAHWLKAIICEDIHNRRNEYVASKMIYVIYYVYHVIHIQISFGFEHQDPVSV